MRDQVRSDYLADIEKIIRRLDFRGIAKVLATCCDEMDRVETTLVKPRERLYLVKGGAAQ